MLELTKEHIIKLAHRFVQDYSLVDAMFAKPLPALNGLSIQVATIADLIESFQFPEHVTLEREVVTKRRKFHPTTTISKYEFHSEESKEELEQFKKRFEEMCTHVLWLAIGVKQSMLDAEAQRKDAAKKLEAVKTELYEALMGVGKPPGLPKGSK